MWVWGQRLEQEQVQEQLVSEQQWAVRPAVVAGWHLPLAGALHHELE